MTIRDDTDETLSASITIRMTPTEREGLDWLASERTKEVRAAAKLHNLKVGASDVLREFIRNETERRGWTGPAKPPSAKRKGRAGEICARCGAGPDALIHTGTHPTRCHAFEAS